MNQILYSSKEISKKISQLFSKTTDTKIVITAFIGTGAKKYIPYKTNNLTIYCWPKEGITNPYVIEEYLKAGATVYFVNKLHTKLYFCKSKGAIITSANLTDNALGDSGLYETGIYDNTISISTINKIIKQFGKLKPIKLKSNQLENLKEKYEDFQRKNPYHAARIKEPQITFDKWFRNRTKPFKFIFAERKGSLNRDIKQSVKEQYPENQIEAWFSNVNINKYKKNSFLLSSSYTKSDGIYTNSICWFYTDYKIKDSLIQLEDINEEHNVPPFKIDQPFKRALKKCYNLNLESKIEKMDEDFLSVLYKTYMKEKRK